MAIIGVGVDTARHVFQVHGVDEDEQPALRRQVRRGDLVKLFAGLAPTRVGPEACGAAHHWARMLRGSGHAVVLLPPQYVTRLMRLHKQSPVSRCLATQPGIGSIAGLKVGDPTAFGSGRHFAAWIGITPRENSTGGRARPGRISRAGDQTLRRLPVQGPNDASTS